MSRKILVLLAVLLASATISSAQVATGTPPFSSIGGGPVDAVNLANLNAHLSVPIINKAGRGLPFNYNLNYDSSVWYPVTSGSTTSWQPVGNWGWQGETEVALGYVVFPLTSTLQQCSEFVDGHWHTYYATLQRGAVYHDNLGVAHYFPTIIVGGCAGLDNETATATEGSGLTYNSGQMITRWGQIINAPSQPTGSGTKTDTNGNQITTNGSTFTDTLGTTVLTVSGTAPNPVTFTYTARPVRMPPTR